MDAQGRRSPWLRKVHWAAPADEGRAQFYSVSKSGEGWALERKEGAKRCQTFSGIYGDQIRLDKVSGEW